MDAKKRSKKKKKVEVKEPREQKDRKDQKEPAPLKTYNITLRTHERRTALQRDSETWGLLRILKQLNRVREDQQWNPRVHEIMTKDLEFLQKLYSRKN